MLDFGLKDRAHRATFSCFASHRINHAAMVHCAQDNVECTDKFIPKYRGLLHHPTPPYRTLWPVGLCTGTAQ